MLGDPRETKLDAEEKRRVAVHESGHAVVAHFSADAEPLHRVTIIPRGMSLGVTQQTPAGDRHIMTQNELDSRLGVLMGGYAAERVVFGNISSGAESDLAPGDRDRVQDGCALRHERPSRSGVITSTRPSTRFSAKCWRRKAARATRRFT